MLKTDIKQGKGINWNNNGFPKEYYGLHLHTLYVLDKKRKSHFFEIIGANFLIFDISEAMVCSVNAVTVQ